MPTARSPAKPRESQRLDETHWIEAALDLLAESGVDAVRVEPLARTLGVTKGSFYWHFKDRADLLSRMLAAWRRRATARIIERLDQEPDRDAEWRLRRLADLPRDGARAERGANLELAIRLWAKRDAAAAAAIAEIDKQRLDYITQLMRRPDANPAEGGTRAFLFYAYLLAEAFLAKDTRADYDAVLSVLLNRPVG